MRTGGRMVAIISGAIVMLLLYLLRNFINRNLPGTGE
jgi:hypothetical protein